LTGNPPPVKDTVDTVVVPSPETKAPPATDTGRGAR
jgi:hypothetical protein